MNENKIKNIVSSSLCLLNNHLYLLIPVAIVNLLVKYSDNFALNILTIFTYFLINGAITHFHKGANITLKLFIDIITKYFIRFLGLGFFLLVVLLFYLLTVLLGTKVFFNIDIDEFYGLIVSENQLRLSFISIYLLIIFPVALFSQIIIFMKDCYVLESIKEGYIYFFGKLLPNLLLLILFQILFYGIRMIDNNFFNENIAGIIIFQILVGYLYLLLFILILKTYEEYGRPFESIKPKIDEIRRLGKTCVGESIEKLQAIIESSKNHVVISLGEKTIFEIKSKIKTSKR